MGQFEGRFARALCGALAAGAVLLWWSAVPARAGAFNEPAGQGIVILSATVDGGDRSFSADGGHFVRTDPYHKRELSAYIEYGVTDWLQAILKPDLTSISLGGPFAARYAGLGTSEVGAQIHLLSWGSAVLAAAGSVQLPATIRESDRALVGNTSRNADGRILLGYGFALGPLPSFLDAQLGYRLRGSGAPDETHVDLTLGTRPRPDLLLLVQTFTTLPQGRGTAWFPASSYSDLEVSAVYDVTLRWSVQLGVYETVAGRGSLRERGLDAAVWRRF